MANSVDVSPLYYISLFIDKEGAVQNPLLLHLYERDNPQVLFLLQLHIATVTISS